MNVLTKSLFVFAAPLMLNSYFVPNAAKHSNLLSDDCSNFSPSLQYSVYSVVFSVQLMKHKICE